MRRMSFLIVSAATLVLAAACSTGAPATLAPGATRAPGATQPPVAVGNQCAGTPTINPAGSPQPVIPGDPDLEAIFPSEIAGEPVENVESIRYVAYLCFSQGQSAVDQIVANTGGIDPNFAYASADATVEGEMVDIIAFRTPGADAGLMIQNFGMLILVLGGDPADNQGTMASANIGGKNVTVRTDADGDISYLYPRGDVLFGFFNASESQAATILAALP